ncbi:MAG: hypothetical protein KA314_05135 [Chloroflexi bacterium]|nr:hypothetical protein [Chloroflexota bacterium]
MSKKNVSRKSNWRQVVTQRDEVGEVELPSGLVVFSRKPDMMDFVLGGDVPNSFFGEMMKLAGATTSEGKIELDILSPDAMKGIVDLSGRMMISCCTDPIVWNNPTVIQAEGDGSGDRLGVNDISANDKMAYFTWATGDATALKTFRQQPGQLGTDAFGGEGVRAETE